MAAADRASSQPGAPADRLVDRALAQQWQPEDLDWDAAGDPDNPLGVRADDVAVSGAPVWARLGDDDRRTVVRHLAGWQISQLAHAEEASIACAARLSWSAPDAGTRLRAATQTVDEVRHAAVFARFGADRIGVSYPVEPGLAAFFRDLAGEARWDVVALGMQVLVEGAALASFSYLRDAARDPLARSMAVLVMQDEARHVAFGRQALAGPYRDLTSRERDERAELCGDALDLLLVRLDGREVWERLDLDVDETSAWVAASAWTRRQRQNVVDRLVPALDELGLLTPTLRRRVADLGADLRVRVDPDRQTRLDDLGARRARAARQLARNDHDG